MATTNTRTRKKQTVKIEKTGITKTFKMKGTVAFPDIEYVASMKKDKYELALIISLEQEQKIIELCKEINDKLSTCYIGDYEDREANLVKPALSLKTYGKPFTTYASDFPIDDIPTDEDVFLYWQDEIEAIITLKEVEYQGKLHITAYIQGVKVLSRQYSGNVINENSFNEVEEI